MTKILEPYIGKECVVYALGTQLVGTVMAVEDNWMSLARTGSATVETVNLDHITRIFEYPRNKNGKRKSFVVD